MIQITGNTTPGPSKFIHDRANSELCWEALENMQLNVVTGDIIAHQVLLNRVPEQATEDSVKYQIYY